MIDQSAQTNESEDRLLFRSLQVGAINLQHRVVMAPMTRSRATWPGLIPNELMARYYGQRASEGGLIVTEATNISEVATGWFGSPGIYARAHIDGWKRVVDAVHARGGFLYAQLWHTGRVSHINMHPDTEPVSASVVPEFWESATQFVSTPAGRLHPSPHRALTIPQIKETVASFAEAAATAKEAGFDGVELHAANGYLIDQFLQNGSNLRQDEYGGSIENRARFLLDAVAAVASVWGKDRVGVRIAPKSTFNQMSDSEPVALFSHIANSLDDVGIAYLHVIEPRARGVAWVDGQDAQTGRLASHDLRKLFQGVLLANGAFDSEGAETTLEQGDASGVSFATLFLANPDLPRRLREHLPLAAADHKTYYTVGPQGYTDYPDAP